VLHSEYNFQSTWTDATFCSLNNLMTLPADDNSDEENEDETGGPEEDGSEDGDE
jgi:hypothetical protein